MSQVRHNFEWTDERSFAAMGLAQGKTQQEVADEVGVDRRTICRWLCDVEFSAEIDRLSVMMNVASRAERLRIAMRVARQKVHEDGSIDTDKDLLDWLKFAQSETDGIKLDLPKLAATFGEDEAPMAGSRSNGSKPTESIN